MELADSLCAVRPIIVQPVLIAIRLDHEEGEKARQLGGHADATGQYPLQPSAELELFVWGKRQQKGVVEGAAPLWQDRLAAWKHTSHGIRQHENRSRSNAHRARSDPLGLPIVSGAIGRKPLP